MKRLPLIIAILILAAAGVTAWWLIGRKPPQRELVLYGDVDLRQVDLAFNDSGRIAAVDVQEGDRVSAVKFWRGWIPAAWSPRSRKPRRPPRRSERSLPGCIMAAARRKSPRREPM